MKDGEEIDTYKTNPKIADTDGDGLNDGEEVTKYKTDPNKKDTDGDNLNDSDEVKIHKTDPLKSDTDSDKLLDGEEISKYKTDPLVADTDKGSVIDGDEVKRGTNPLDPSDDIEKMMEAAPTFDPVYFKYNKYEVQQSEEAKLKKVLSYLEKHTDVDLLVKGHTDGQGEPKYNQKLSDQRANAVKDWLVKKGVSATRITAKGFGKTQPVSDNSTAEGRSKNRRAELIVGGMH